MPNAGADSPIARNYPLADFLALDRQFHFLGQYLADDIDLAAVDA